jgi:hypothetical protein
MTSYPSIYYTYRLSSNSYTIRQGDSNAKYHVTHENGGDRQPIDSVWDAGLLPYKELMKLFTGSRPSLMALALPFSTHVIRGFGQDDATKSPYLYPSF